MTPLADTHVHLLADLDDGPETPDVALAMCRTLVSQGVRYVTALAHQNPDYPENTADRLRSAATQLAVALREKKIPLSVHPTGEIMLSADTLDEWRAGTLMSVGDHRQWLLVEMPHDGFLDVLPLAGALRPEGVGLIIAHAERYPPLLDDPTLTGEWIAAGCLIQVTARALAEAEGDEEDALRRWATGGFIHLLGSDGHGIDRRRPELAAGFGRLKGWIGRRRAEEIACVRGAAVLRGESVVVPPPAPIRRSWFARLFGA
ncbi:CpsB/CapC family capsule biosynthesis tyrosine phosphatase [Gemmata sp. JC717]|uniref:tyrosine-protein phosphatase n=1 Tax=Gemmata algarum TaxID=2975278 RepID=UPI0021BAF36B|nr:CpsB/CapC family capsule biosynthesis tyrosine phosphatase [Gemmata algarum]MDY3553563.1 CpsB/CapC family capsule biosynthesis tyrosine phosphatase [Gemmata algarum]